MADLNTVTITWDDHDRPVITVDYASTGDGVEADPEEWLAALAERLPDKSAEHLRVLLKRNESRGFVSLVDLAADAGVDKKAIDGWNRNLGRSIKAVVRDHGFLRRDKEDGTAQLFDFQWDEPNNRWLYAVPTKYRAPLAHALGQR